MNFISIKIKKLNYLIIFIYVNFFGNSSNISMYVYNQ